MKPTKMNIRELGGNDRALILLGVLAALLATFACSSNNSKRVNNPSKPITGGDVRPAALQTVAPAVSQPAPVPAPTVKKADSVKSNPPNKLLTYRSRDYGVSFLYPWQYGFASGRALISGDSGTKSDGDDGEFTLARVEIPKGYYPDTDFESGYLTLSLNENVDEQGCQAEITPPQGGMVETETINGVEFRWVETEDGGHGSSAQVRNYAAFTGGTCYEVEMGLKTRNDHGMAREVNVDSVMSRLDAVLKTIEIAPALRDVDASKTDSPNSAQTPTSQN